MRNVKRRIITLSTSTRPALNFFPPTNQRGSNNRLNERSANRQNGNRLFDSQNNNRGGYNVGDIGAGGFNGRSTRTVEGSRFASEQNEGKSIMSLVSTYFTDLLHIYRHPLLFFFVYRAIFPCISFWFIPGCRVDGSTWYKQILTIDPHCFQLTIP